MNNYSGTRGMTILALMSAISIIMTFTPIGMIFIPFLAISCTISHIPTIIMSVFAGPIYGAVVGGIFGLTTLVRAAVSPQGVLDPLFLNPLISVLPRILVGITPYYAYKLSANILSKITDSKSIPIMIGGAIGSLTNTALVLGMLFILYNSRLAEIGGTAAALIITVVTSSGIAEMLVSVIISFPIIKALSSVLKKV